MKRRHRWINTVYRWMGKEPRYWTAGEYYQKYGKLTKQNVTVEQLKKGAERQWRRIYCRNFQFYEFTKRMNDLFPHSPISFEWKACDCPYCLGKEESLVRDFPLPSLPANPQEKAGTHELQNG